MSMNKRARSSFMKHAPCNARPVWSTPYAWHGREVSVIMDPLECTLVPKPSLAADGPLFWPASRARLVLLFETLTDTIVVRGIDPDVADKSALVFRAELLPAQKDRFVQAVRDGDEPTPVGNDNQDPGAPVPAVRKPRRPLVRKASAGKVHIDAIVITDPPGPGQGPKTYLLELPSAVSATGTRG